MPASGVRYAVVCSLYGSAMQNQLSMAERSAGYSIGCGTGRRNPHPERFFKLSQSMAEAVMSPQWDLPSGALFSLSGVDTIDYIFVTHGDDDHISGVQEMLENQMFGVKIRNLVMPSPEHQDEKLIALAQTAVKNGIRVAVMDSGDEITSDGAEEEIGLILTCIGPESGLGVDPGNETSLVLDLSYGEFDHAVYR